MNYKFLIATSVLALSLFSCAKKEQDVLTKSGLSLSAFNQTVDNKENKLWVLKNANGMEVAVTNFGARIVSVMVPDKDGKFQDVVLGFDSISGYLNNKSDFGAAIGRYGNRIAKGKFTLDSTEYQLTLNNGENSLHGGTTGFQYRMFDIAQIDSTKLECTYTAADGENGYPGNFTAKVTYTLTADNALDISYEATTDKPTVVNLTNHSYFNLSGNPTTDILNHTLFMDADKYTPVNPTMIPTGEIATVKGTPMDFTTATAIGLRIDTAFAQLQMAGGYDHNWIFTKSGDISTALCKAVSPVSGISLEVYTTEPAVQFYTGNFLDGTLKGKKGIVYNKRSGFCLETQHYPDSPNQPSFPTTVLRPGETYKSQCVYKFGIAR